MMNEDTRDTLRKFDARGRTAARRLLHGATFSILIGAVAACGVAAGGGEEEETATAAQSLTQCGSSCPAGWHPASRRCNKACGAYCSASAPNEVTCEPDVEAFYQCASTCPLGWHITQYACVESCGPCNGNNHSRCARNALSFDQCSTVCPAGYSRVGDAFHDPACFYPYPNPNAASCAANRTCGGMSCDDGNPCTNDFVDYTNCTCTHTIAPAGAVCRASTGACDPAEVCTGSSTLCPADQNECP